MNSIFAVNIDGLSEIFVDLLALVNDSDKNSVLKYRQKKDQYRKLVSCLLLQFFIKKLFSLSNYKLLYNLYGKPYLKENSEYNFNISHSGRWVVGVVSEKPVGIDIELVNEIDNFKDIAKRFFSSDEYEFLIEQPNGRVLQLFYEIWTKKESLIKAEGKGLSIPLDSFTVPFTSRGEVGFNESIWNVYLIDFKDVNYKLSISSLLSLDDFLPVKYISINDLL